MLNEKEIKGLLAKLKLTQCYPYKIPNTNIIILSDNSIEVDSVITPDGYSQYYRREFGVYNLHRFLQDTVNEDFQKSLYYTTSYNGNLGMFYIGLAVPFETDNFIHFFRLNNLVSQVGTLFVIDKSDFSLFKKIDNLNRSHIPIYDKCNDKIVKIGEKLY